MFKLAHRSLIAAWVAAFLSVPAASAQVNMQELQKPGQLEEKVLGPSDAKVTVIEYASMSCPHCAHFDETTFDQFKLKYVDSGKVRYVFREFPLNAPAFAGAMIARCAPADKFFDVIHAYFRSQSKWLAAGDLKASMLEIAKGFGFTDQSFDACITNQALFKAISDVRDRGSKFGVESTPTFFINGTKHEGALSLEDLDKAITPLLQ